MKAVKVQYTVKPEYADTNKRNIRKVMEDLQEIANPGIRYSSFVLDDGKTFVHFGVYSDQAAMDVLNNLPSFQFFRDQLKASGPDAPPNADDLNLVDSSYEIF
jgi:quinol monooxygenase YgiN